MGLSPSYGCPNGQYLHKLFSTLLLVKIELSLCVGRQPVWFYSLRCEVGKVLKQSPPGLPPDLPPMCTQADYLVKMRFALSNSA